MRFAIILVIILPLSIDSWSQKRTVGVIESIDPYPGYVLFSPHADQNVYLINNCGELVKRWTSLYFPGNAVYLQPNGTLYRAGRTTTDSKITAGGAGGIIEQIDWNNEVQWSFTYVSDFVRHHHDFKVLPNGNVLLIAWEVIEKNEAIENGRKPDLVSENIPQIWPDHIIEVKPAGTTNGDIVWEWHAWDHLIQDFDKSKKNFGMVSENPGKIDVNYAIDSRADWLHINSIDYLESRDMILLSVPYFNEIWIIDHSTTTEEAKGIAGDLKYRWGNPQAYKKGTDLDQKLFGQHTVHWIGEGNPNSGDILIFNNGEGRKSGNFSTIDIIKFNEITNFPKDEAGRFLPDQSTILYKGNPEESFFAPFLSGAQQLSNGNLLICSGSSGTFFEVTPSGSQVWEYINPVSFAGILNQGDDIIPPGFSDPANLVFRAIKYPITYPAFQLGLNQPTGPIENNPTDFDCELLLTTSLVETELNMYPNPASKSVVIQVSKALVNRTMKMFSSSGQMVLQENITTNKSFIIDLSMYSKGVYFIYIGNNVTKLIIQ